jgi:hypothetical protein
MDWKKGSASAPTTKAIENFFDEAPAWLADPSPTIAMELTANDAAMTALAPIQRDRLSAPEVSDSLFIELPPFA